jgi:ABC-type proline/glycine betaine transport system permease subunit
MEVKIGLGVVTLVSTSRIGIRSLQRRTFASFMKPLFDFAQTAATYWLTK